MKEQTCIDFRGRKRVTRFDSDFNRSKVVDSEHVNKAFRPAEEIPLEPVKKPQLPVRQSSRIAATKKLKQTVLILKNDEPSVNEADSISKRKMELVQNHNIKKQKTVHVEPIHDDHPLTKEKKNIKPSIKDLILKQSLKEITETTPVESETILEDKRVQEDEPSIPTEDTPSPPSSCFIEPVTPPTHLTNDHYIAPFKTYLTESDKERIDYEKTTLERLRKALDIILTDRAARNRPALYHQIEPVLRNSTRRTITISHICKIMYIVPSLYLIQPKELRDFGGKVTEAFLLEFGKDWLIPLSGKDLQKRADMLGDAITDYFKTHTEYNASIPEAPLPRLGLVVDKKEWVKDAKLPPGVRSLLEAHERAKEAEKEREKPKPKPTGSVKDRMAALRARLAEKKANNNK
ncbi:uncharacterized protein BX663DRAFT_534076 [Cokeromyces recurvatus]|uniref:uncharacterized protein n=1 Tax=Cokeromyces recurvatus TaxID=90255 RepID=UPI00221E5E61|nr:uncharacterized protein BX663DRAFT_534076 [Cokeromyces recurvatus]KAI7907951.1 hypothetical protein BX663DRAFT_534076 [Cokeromyces recurvatus]